MGCCLDGDMLGNGGMNCRGMARGTSWRLKLEEGFCAEGLGRPQGAPLQGGVTVHARAAGDQTRVAGRARTGISGSEQDMVSQFCIGRRNGIFSIFG